ncbi:hypothetical protein [Alcanivorax sp. 24]|uniref:hypothetical protein n=1 Tax=Alcanivorax sp. 24 TaxID=2545266 RepID=UPI00105E06AE|nr:hypothetical protein [Alcanivorax sp. 24]
MNCSKTRHSITALLLSFLMLSSTVAGAIEVPYSVNVDASCLIHVSAGEQRAETVEIHTSDCERHQCCLPHGTSATLTHPPLSVSQGSAAKWRFPAHAHAPSLAIRPPVPPPNSNGLI